MVKYHPDTRFLTDYAAGSLPESQALCVSAHLHYCPACRLKVGELMALGTELFVTQEPAAVADDSFARLMARVDDSKTAAPAQRAPQALASKAYQGKLPRAIQKLTNGDMEAMTWHRIGNAFRYSPIRIKDKRRETSLMHISAGGKLPKHHHKGDEITVVLKGSFSDQEGRYHVGDYIIRSGKDTHTPVASQDEDCLCLASLDAPIVMSNWLYRLLVPLYSRLVGGSATA